MKKIVIFYILPFLVVITSCKQIKDKDIIGVYMEDHKYYKDTIWILPRGDFKQKVYNRDGSLFYNATSHWSIIDGEIFVDSLFTLPEGCDKVEALEVPAGASEFHDLRISQNKGRFAIFVPYWQELEDGIYFYKVE